MVAAIAIILAALRRSARYVPNSETSLPGLHSWRLHWPPLHRYLSVRKSTDLDKY